MHEISNETLEEKVERLEFYIDLLREFATDPDMFVVWDWAIGNRLNEKQVKSIMKTITNYHLKFIKQQPTNVSTLFDEFSKEIHHILNGNGQTSDKEIIFQLLKRVSKMGISEELIHEFLKLE